ncbi:MAG: MFS transporter [Pseudomonadota bacterium]|nr:MFS transporter [Pseudomonadota bacterium]
MLTNKYKYVMWLVPLSFFAFQFILRLWPGLMMQPIMEQFSIDASHFGMLAAFYYYGYASMQIPVAILLDRYSARTILFAFAVLCGLDTLLFTYTDTFVIAVFSRFLIGVGSAVGFLGVSKVVSEWFPKEQYARMIGLSFTFGLMGAIYGGKPISLLISTYSWQNVAYTLALVSIAIGCTAYLVLRSPESSEKSASRQSFKFANFRELLTSPLIWCLAIANLLMVGALEGFADVWGVPYLMKAYPLDKADCAGLISFIFFGMLFGGPLLAFFARKFGNYPVIAASGIGMAIAFITLLQHPAYNHLMLACLFFVVGVLCCYQVIVFAAGANLVAPQNLGVTVAFLNCINMLGGSFFHTSIGKIMDIFWTGALNAEGLRVYDSDVYRYALSIIPLCAIVGAIMICIIGIKIAARARAAAS